MSGPRISEGAADAGPRDRSTPPAGLGTSLPALIIAAGLLCTVVALLLQLPAAPGGIGWSGGLRVGLAGGALAILASLLSSPGAGSFRAAGVISLLALVMLMVDLATVHHISAPEIGRWPIALDVLQVVGGTLGFAGAVIAERMR